MLLQAKELMDAQYARALQLVREHHEEIVALYLELWHRKVRGAAQLNMPGYQCLSGTYCSLPLQQQQEGACHTMQGQHCGAWVV
jgi:hypothetical protein